MAQPAGDELPSGSGEGGRIERDDVAAALARGGPPAQPAAPTEPVAPRPPEAAPSNPAATAKGAVTQQELTRAQQLVARRAAESKATVPHLVLETEVAIARCGELREQVRELTGVAVSDQDMVVRACAIALAAFPRANGSYRDGRFELHSRVNVGIVVASGDALLVPTLFDADRKPLAAIAEERLLLEQRARSGALTPPELAGATFTVANAGDEPITRMTAVVIAPQAAILAVGAVRGETLALTLSCDHRILYGTQAGGFLGRVRVLLERPLSLL